MDDNKTGLVRGLVFGTGALILVTIVVLVVVSTIDNANLLEEGRVTTYVNDETGRVNETAYTLAGASEHYVSGTFTIVALYDFENNVTISLANASTSTVGVVTNATADTYDWALINYTYTTMSNEEVTTDAMTSNYTSGIDNVSGKIPTVLLLGAIVLLFGVLVLLIRQYKQTGFGGEAGSL